MKERREVGKGRRGGVAVTGCEVKTLLSHVDNEVQADMRMIYGTHNSFLQTASPLMSAKFPSE
ncbi:hypothetical protein E2C01_032399 [Portunus trituberculatus]|uniref:Uncharacterized protein n=1 Tax=Portunus trituberculatus TaxID=210409 RepID=A0A5B7F193_PORTR|nr:hypothetical protein [Portunus trituberculatus]